MNEPQENEFSQHYEEAMAWLNEKKAEAERLGVPLRQLVPVQLWVEFPHLVKAEEAFSKAPKLTRAEQLAQLARRKALRKTRPNDGH